MEEAAAAVTGWRRWFRGSPWVFVLVAVAQIGFLVAEPPLPWVHIVIVVGAVLALLGWALARRTTG